MGAHHKPDCAAPRAVLRRPLQPFPRRAIFQPEPLPLYIHMSAKPLVLAACCSGLFAPALALDLPSGWTSREENNLTHYQPQDIGDRANMAHRVEVQGKPLHINFTAFPAGDGKIRLVPLLPAEDAALHQRYQDDANATIAGL